MKEHYVSRSGFEAIFNQCMKEDTIYFADNSKGKDKPRMIIRDFDTCISNEDINDVEFYEGELDKAWKYFSSLDEIRVMDVSGTIYLDAFE